MPPKFLRHMRREDVSSKGKEPEFIRSHISAVLPTHSWLTYGEGIFASIKDVVTYSQGWSKDFLLSKGVVSLDEQPFRYKGKVAEAWATISRAYVDDLREFLHTGEATSILDTSKQRRIVDTSSQQELLFGAAFGHDEGGSQYLYHVELMVEHPANLQFFHYSYLPERHLLLEGTLKTRDSKYLLDVRPGIIQ